MTTRLRHPARLAVGVAVLLAVLVVLLVSWRAWHVRAELNAAKSAATDLQSALEARDVDRAKVALADFQAHSSAAADQTDGPVWGGLSHLPAVGDDAAAVHTLSSVLESVSHRGIAPLVDIVQSFDDGKLSPHRGRIPVDRIQELQRPVRESRQTFDRAATQLAGLDPTSYVGPLASANEQIDEIVTKARKTLGRADKVVRLLPSMLGADGPRKYLLVLQNNAEIRSTGGFPGSVFLLETDRGAIKLTHPVAGAAFAESPEPVVQLTDVERELFGERVATRFVDANKIPSFPRVAEIWAAQWKRMFDESVDGVVSTDPVMLSYLMRATGPLVVDGVTLDADNVVAELLNRAYFRIADPAEQDAFFRSAGAAAFAAVTSSPDVQTLIKEMKRGADEGRLLVHSSDRADQRVIAGTELAGDLTSRDNEIGLYVNDFTSSKLSYYMTATTVARSERCTPSGEVVSGKTVLASSAPLNGVGLPPYVIGGSGLVPPGTEGIEVLLVAPEGARIQALSVDGKAVRVRRLLYDGLNAGRVQAIVDPGESVPIEWLIVDVKGPGREIRLRTTPQVRSQPPSFVSMHC